MATRIKKTIFFLIIIAFALWFYQTHIRYEYTMVRFDPDKFYIAQVKRDKLTGKIDLDINTQIYDNMLKSIAKPKENQ